MSPYAEMPPSSACGVLRSEGIPQPSTKNPGDGFFLCLGMKWGRSGPLYGQCEGAPAAVTAWEVGYHVQLWDIVPGKRLDVKAWRPPPNTLPLPPPPFLGSVFVELMRRTHPAGGSWQQTSDPRGSLGLGRLIRGSRLVGGMGVGGSRRSPELIWDQFGGMWSNRKRHKTL